jgi:hypothetical protein
MTMNAKLTKSMLALLLVCTAGTAAAHDRDRDRGGRDHGPRYHERWHGGDPWCHEHRVYHRHVVPWHDAWKERWHRDWHERSGYRGPGAYGADDSLTIIFRTDLR